RKERHRKLALLSGDAREFSSKHKEISLDVREDLVSSGVQLSSSRLTQDCIELIDGPVGVYPRRRFRNTSPPEESGRLFIDRLRVDLRVGECATSRLPVFVDSALEALHYSG